MIEIGKGLFGHSSGALWIPAESALLVADVHLGYAWAQRRRGQLGPLTEGGVNAKLTQVLEELDPRLLLVLGDLVHAPRPGLEEKRVIEQSLQGFAQGRQLVLVQGNHDRGFARDFGHLPVTVRPFWSGESITAVHGDRPEEYPLPEGQTLVVGHWHPSVSIADSAGATLRMPVFLVWPKAIVLPAFSPFAAGFDVSRGFPAAMLESIPCGKQAAEVYAASGKRIRRLGQIQPRMRKARSPRLSDGSPRLQRG
jgi:putative SbcD/Mre11-related phosphoesterase